MSSTTNRAKAIILELHALIVFIRKEERDENFVAWCEGILQAAQQGLKLISGDK